MPEELVELFHGRRDFGLVVNFANNLEFPLDSAAKEGCDGNEQFFQKQPTDQLFKIHAQLLLLICVDKGEEQLDQQEAEVVAIRLLLLSRTSFQKGNYHVQERNTVIHRFGG